jgi:hypothetical protein
MAKWLKDQDAVWRATLSREVTDPCDLKLLTAREKYQAAVEARLTAATTAGDLDSVVSWRREKELFALAHEVPPEDDPNTLPALKQLRAAWRTDSGRIARERAEKTTAWVNRYDAALAQAQTYLTKSQRIDEALLVRNQRETLATMRPAPVAPTATPEPARAGPPAGMEAMLTPDVTTQRMARVEVPGANMVTLLKNEKIWSDRPVTLTNIPLRYHGFQFTQLPAHALTLNFTVTADGLVALGCSARWGTTADPETAKDFMTEGKLLAAGWVRQKRDQIDTSASDMQFLIYARHCKAGEHFSYRTEKYAAPILLLR